MGRQGERTSAAIEVVEPDRLRAGVRHRALLERPGSGLTPASAGQSEALRRFSEGR
jgi:hypothetical protein